MKKQERKIRREAWRNLKAGREKTKTKATFIFLQAMRLSLKVAKEYLDQYFFFYCHDSAWKQNNFEL